MEQHEIERRQDAAGRDLVPLVTLAEEFGVERRTLDRVASDEAIERLKFAGDRRTWVPEAEMRRAMSLPHRRPGRQHQAGGQPRGAGGRFDSRPSSGTRGR